MYLINLHLARIHICICDLLDTSIFIIKLWAWRYHTYYIFVSELVMIKHKYLILWNMILFETITVLFSVHNSILFSTLETSCGNICNCPDPHVTWLALLKRNSNGAPLLENSPQAEGTRRIFHKRRKWGGFSIFGE